MSSSSPISVGITNAHWANFCIANASWLRANNIIDQDVYENTKQKLESLANTSPEPSFSNFKDKAIKLISEVVVRDLVQIPEAFANHVAGLMVIKDNNDFVFSKYSNYRNNLKDIASGNLELFQLLDNKVTTVGYQLALFYNSFKTILAEFILSRKYVEFINSEVSLIYYFQTYLPDRLDFIAQKVGLSNVSFFPSSTFNWFVLRMKDFGTLVRSMVRYIVDMSDKKLLEVDISLFAKALNSADALLAEKPSSFEIDFSLYSKMSINMDVALDCVNEIITTMKLNLEAFEKESVTVDKQKYYPLVIQLAARIFNGKDEESK